MNVIIGVDPHKATHHVVAVSDDEHELAQVSVRACRTQTSRLVSWAEPFPSRTWAIEGADGLGYLLSQQLVAAGERVVDVPATLAARTRVLSSSRSNKNDPNDARAVALTALRHNDLREVRPVGHSEVLRLLAKRNKDIGDQRTRLVGRMHALLVEMAPGGIAKESTPLTSTPSSRDCRRHHRLSRCGSIWRSSCSTTSDASMPNSRRRTNGSGLRLSRRRRR
jgi:hypothetical protein